MKGKNGDFWGCTGYPQCKYIESNAKKNPLPEKRHRLTFLNNLQICVNPSNKVVWQAKVSRFNIVGHQCCAEIPLAL
ncbi:hypothetical protein [Avibacterium paragallinarum]